MRRDLPRRAGTAMAWRGAQLGGVKLIHLVRIVVLGRLLAPDDFGLLAISVIALDLLLSLTNLGVAPALVQRAESERAHFDAGWTLGLARSVGVAAVLWIAAPWIASLFAEPRAAALLRMLALRPVIESVASIRVAELTRELRFGALAAMRFAEALANAGVSIALAPAYGVWALVIGPLAGAIAYTLTSYVAAPYRPRLRIEKSAALSLVRFGRWIFATAVIAVAGRSLLQLGISRTLGAAGLGTYFLAAKLAFLPADVATEVVGSVSFPVFSRLQADREGAARAFRSVLVGLGGVLIPSTLVLFALAPALVEHLLGPKWEGTVAVIRILVWVNVVGILGDAVVPLLQGSGHPERATAMETIQYLLLAGLVWPLAATWGVPGAAGAWLPAIFSSQIVGFVFVRALLPRPFLHVPARMAAIGVAGALAAGAAWVLTSVPGGIPGLVLGALVAGLLLPAAIVIADRFLGLGLATDVTRVFPAAGRLLRFLGANGAGPGVTRDAEATGGREDLR